MDQNVAKVKKWGWWAIAGLAAVLVIAGLIIAISSSGPKPTDQVAENDETSEQQDNVTEEPAKEEDKKEDEKPVQELPTISETPQADLPKTGPEDTILPILGAGITGYLIALAAATLRRRS